MRPGLVIFDCDGVLVDSEAIASRVFSACAQGLGLAVSQAQADRKFRGRSLGDCLAQLAEELGRPLPEGFLEQLNQQTYRAFRSELRAIDGVSAALDELHRRGLRTCVASSGSHEKMRVTLSLTGLLARLDGRLFSASQVPRGKPAPDLVQFAAAQMRTDVREAIVVEDSLVGARGALAAGTRVLGYVPDGEPDAALRRHAFSSAGVPTFRCMSALPDLVSLRGLRTVPSG